MTSETEPVTEIKITPPDFKSAQPIFTASARGLTATGESEDLARVRLLKMVVNYELKKYGR